jgi:hypothetical protein
MRVRTFEPFQNELVSECIILDGLQGHHGPALRLLTHGLDVQELVEQVAE